MSWTAVVPLKGAVGRKSRLAPALGAAERAELSRRMATHVLGRLAACAGIAEVLLLSPEPPSQAGVGWRRDEGRGLNPELALLRAERGVADLLVLHADLPLLQVAEVEALLAAGSDVVLAPDRHKLGTNALALRGGRAFDFAFGQDSFARHLAQAPRAAVLDRAGLRLDVDTPADLEAARRAGFAFPAPAATP